MLIQVFCETLKFLVISFEDLLILDGTLIKLLLLTFSDTFVGTVVKLGDRSVVHLPIGCGSQNLEDLDYLLLALRNLFHKLASSVTVLDFHR